jgi:hypothetical protein
MTNRLKVILDTNILRVAKKVDGVIVEKYVQKIGLLYFK